MGVTLTVLGRDGSYPGKGGACSGYLLTADTESGPFHVWMDAGSGTLANLQRHVALEELHAIVLSHQHVDHWSDIEGYWVALTYGEQAGHVVQVYAPPSLRAEAEPRTHGGAFVWHDLTDAGPSAIGPFSITTARTDHPVETYAMRFEFEGKALVYSADTGPRWSLAGAFPGMSIDLALMEASYVEGKVGSDVHITATQAGELAKDAGAARLVITHIWPTIDQTVSQREAEAAYGGPVEVAEIGARFHL